MHKDINKESNLYDQSDPTNPRHNNQQTEPRKDNNLNTGQEIEQHSGQQFDDQDQQQQNLEQSQGHSNYSSVQTSSMMAANKKHKKKNKKKRAPKKYECCNYILFVIVVGFILINGYIYAYIRQKQDQSVRYGQQYTNQTHLNQSKYNDQKQHPSNTNRSASNINISQEDIQVDTNTNTSTDIEIETNKLSDAITNQSIPQKNQLSNVADQLMYDRITMPILRGLANKHKNSIHIKQSQNRANRIRLGMPLVSTPQISTWKISKNTQSHLSMRDNNRQACVIINGISSITQTTLSSIQTLLVSGSAIDSIIVYGNVVDGSIVDDWFGAFNVDKKYGIARKDNIIFNADYQWVSEYLYDGRTACGSVVYMSAAFSIGRYQMQGIDAAIAGMKQLQVLYTQSVQIKQPSALTYSHTYTQQELPNLTSTDLQHINPSILPNYMFIFDPIYISIISPLNFAYYVRYTLAEVLILPMLAIVQNTHYLRPIKQVLHSMDGYIYGDSQVIKFGQLDAKSQYSYCFVSYTSDPHKLDHASLASYLDSITNMANHNGTQINIVIYVPYKYAPEQPSIWQAAYKIIKLEQYKSFRSIRLHIRANKTQSSHAVYESAYQYCPKQSTIISSRHNVQFMQDFITQLTKNINTRKHYYHCNYMDQNNNINSLAQAPQYVQKQRFQIRKSNMFRQHYRHVQIYTNQFMRTTTFWVLKSGQLDFYETEAVFFVLMMETIKLQVHYINKTLYKVSARNYTKRQQQQIENIKKYAEYGALPRLQLNPYKYNSLDNPAFRRFAPDLMEKNIHQVWLGYGQISQIRMHLHQTIKQVNPLFNVSLWRSNNITKYTFPLTYTLTQRVLEYHKTAKTSFMAMAADLLRYQVVYQYGGIYVDFKMQAARPADGFLKYQSFYLDAGNGDQRFGSPVAVGVGVIGANKNNYHLKIILNQIIEESKIRFILKGIPKQSGGFIVRKAYKDEELFMSMGLGYHLLFPKPYDNPVNQCGGFDKQFEANQKVYVIFDYFQQKNIKMGIPCKQYPQSYFINFTPLARTWRGDKRNVD